MCGRLHVGLNRQEAAQENVRAPLAFAALLQNAVQKARVRIDGDLEVMGMVATGKISQLPLAVLLDESSSQLDLCSLHPPRWRPG